MRVVEAFPAGTAGGCCIATKHAVLHPHERVIDTGLDLEAFPMWGRICISESAVQAMNSTLGSYGELAPLQRVVRTLDARVDELESEVARLTELNVNLMRELTKTVNA